MLLKPRRKTVHPTGVSGALKAGAPDPPGVRRAFDGGRFEAISGVDGAHDVLLLR